MKGQESSMITKPQKQRAHTIHSGRYHYRTTA